MDKEKIKSLTNKKMGYSKLMYDEYLRKNKIRKNAFCVVILMMLLVSITVAATDDDKDLIGKFKVDPNDIDYSVVKDYIPGDWYDDKGNPIDPPYIRKTERYKMPILVDKEIKEAEVYVDLDCYGYDYDLNGNLINTSNCRCIEYHDEKGGLKGCYDYNTEFEKVVLTSPKNGSNYNEYIEYKKNGKENSAYTSHEYEDENRVKNIEYGLNGEIIEE